jgi:hypothetical protein
MSKRTTHERLAQKRHTRAAILAAARALVAEGEAVRRLLRAARDELHG